MAEHDPQPQTSEWFSYANHVQQSKIIVARSWRHIVGYALLDCVMSLDMRHVCCSQLKQIVRNPEIDVSSNQAA